MAEKVTVTKSLLDGLAQSINARAGTTGKKTIAQMRTAVEGISAGSAPETVTWHQCPERARKFVAEVTYDPADYSVSRIAEYATESYVEANYKPIGKTVGDKTFYNQVPNIWTDFVAGEVFGQLKPLDHVTAVPSNMAYCSGAANWRQKTAWCWWRNVECATTWI